MRGLLARSGGFGAMGHLGHIAIAEKLLAYTVGCREIVTVIDGEARVGVAAAHGVGRLGDLRGSGRWTRPPA